MRRLLLAVLVILSVAACGTDNDEATTEGPLDRPAADQPDVDPAPGDPSEEQGGGVDALRDAVEAYTEAFGRGDGEIVWGMRSRRCQEREARSWVEEAVRMAAALYGELRVTSFDGEIDGDRATVSYSVSVPELSQSQQYWVAEAGSWRWDGC